MINVMRGGNVGATATTLHPNGSAYVIIKRDIPGGCDLVYEQGWGGELVRIVKAYIGRGELKKIQDIMVGEERAAGRPTGWLVEAIDRPLGTSSLVCRPDGSILANLAIGGTDSLCDWVVDVIPNACPPWSWQGTWPLTVSATDDEARRIAGSAVSSARSAQEVAGQAKDKAEEALKRAKNLPGGLTNAGVIQAVADDLGLGLRKAPDGTRGGVLVHVLWQLLDQLSRDLLYLTLRDKNSPLVNAIKRGGPIE